MTLVNSYKGGHDKLESRERLHGMQRLLPLQFALLAWCLFSNSNSNSKSICLQALTVTVNG